MLEISITMWPKYSRVDLQCLRETEPFPSLVKCSSATSALETCLVLFWSLATALSSLEKVRLAKISYLSFHLKAQIILINFTTKIKVDFNLDFKEQFWRILKTTLISRPLMNFILISKNSSDTFQNNLDFKATLLTYKFTFAGYGAFRVPQKTTLISKQLMNFIFWPSKKARITRKHNEIKFEFEKTSNGLHIIFTKDNTIKLVCCNWQFFYLVSDASKPDWRKYLKKFWRIRKILKKTNLEIFWSDRNKKINLKETGWRK